MAVSGFLFLAWRLFEIITLIPIMGMLAWFVHQYVHANLLTPAYILVLFIVSVIALAWAIFTTIDYLRARHDALSVAFFDLAIVGALIAGVYYLRGIAGQNCTTGNAGASNGGVYINVNTNKTCAMLKASFALAIIDILAFFVTFLLALLVHRNHRNDDRVVVKREYRSSNSNSRGAHRSRSRDHRSSRDYDNRPSGGSRRSHQSNSRRQYYV
ncbi:hypothetical protein LTR35_007298 [Friedmanniomyces endolithicus]|nr:hypothetical protein LTR35_007298 [Friedmanniomyces endolithicus]KAK0297388.1 hypothetical protein LTS00_004111 [Friedmanniomyces endolithicus]KAK1008257.1 hypothetical protein LTR54_006048 [Friedmanniomyces endolithicus]